MWFTCIVAKRNSRAAFVNSPIRSGTEVTSGSWFLVPGSWFRRFRGSEVSGFSGSEVSGFGGSEVSGFGGSEVGLNSGFRILNSESWRRLRSICCRTLFLLTTTLLGIPSVAAQPEQVPYFLTFAAKDRHGVYVRDLDREKVRITVGGEPVEVLFLGGRDVEASYAIVLENSPRTAQHPESRPQWGIVNPIDRIRYNLLDDFFNVLTVNGGEILIAQFFREFEVIQDFTREEDTLRYAVTDMRLNASGVFTDDIEVGRALGRGFDLLKNREAKRKSLVLFTLTIDRTSYQHLEEYQQMLQRGDVDVYVLSYAPRFVSGSSSTFVEKMNAYFFRNLVAETAGRAYLAGEFAYLDELFTDLKGRLANSFTAGFYISPSEEPREREVKIELECENCEVFHRKQLVY
jgi:hypothetical protein